MLRKTVAILAMALGTGAISSANALVLECKNVADVPISVALSYLDYDGKTWMVEGWYNFPAGSRANIELESSNDIFYIFGEFESGDLVSGGPGALNLPVKYRTFKHIQGQQNGQPDAEVSFVRGVASQGVAQITFGPLAPKK
ncbi:hypothetical protein [Anaerobiospirillum succiniciproducens]|uniref:hypothetical protein n=1 Tax=Anaerobiospirillum succiniciproducens TaxID=13335 RepID=UPI003F8CA92C